MSPSIMKGLITLRFHQYEYFDSETLAHLSIKEGREPIQYPIRFRIDCTDCLGTNLGL